MNEVAPAPGRFGSALLELTLESVKGPAVHLTATKVSRGASSEPDLLAVLVPSELGRLSSIRLRSRRDEFVTSRWAARRLLSKVLGSAPVDVVLHSPPGRRPWVDAPVHVGWSHSKGVVAVAACRSASVGVDVESEGDHLIPLARRFASSDATDAVEASRAWVEWEARRKLATASADEWHRRLTIEGKGAYALCVALGPEPPL